MAKNKLTAAQQMILDEYRARYTFTYDAWSDADLLRIQNPGVEALERNAGIAFMLWTSAAEDLERLRAAYGVSPIAEAV